ncbi:MAG: BatA domain-containing protein [Bauldia sp.]
MMSAFAFANAGMLAALIALPVIWYFLRLTPPKPKVEAFPPTRLLMEIAQKEEQPARSPWWLTALRLALAAAVILALAGPVFKPTGEVAPGSGPLLLVVDNGWSAAPQWPSMLATAHRIVDLATAAGRPVALMATAEPANQSLLPGDGDAILKRLDALAPEPWAANYAALTPGARGGRAVGRVRRRRLAVGRPRWQGRHRLRRRAHHRRQRTDDRLRRRWRRPLRPEAAHRRRRRPHRSDRPPPGSRRGGRHRAGERHQGARGRRGALRLRRQGHQRHGEVHAAGRAAQRHRPRRGQRAGDRGRRAASRRPLPPAPGRAHLRRVGRGRPAAALAALLHLPRARTLRRCARAAGRQRRRRHPAAHRRRRLGDRHGRHRQPDHRRRGHGDQVGAERRHAGALRRAAPGRRPPTAWCPSRSATATACSAARCHGRPPQPLASFNQQSPFAGLTVPQDVVVRRQVLAEPDGALADRTWAALADGTPLVTAAPSGKGWIILFHVTADTSWSTLPLSGTFVEMLRRVVAFSGASGGKANANAQPAPPYRLLDGSGHFTSPRQRPRRSAATSRRSSSARSIRRASTARRTASGRSTCSTTRPSCPPSTSQASPARPCAPIRPWRRPCWRRG